VLISLSMRLLSPAHAPACRSQLIRYLTSFLTIALNIISGGRDPRLFRARDHHASPPSLPARPAIAPLGRLLSKLRAGAFLLMFRR